MHTKTEGKGTETPQKTEPKLPASVGGSPGGGVGGQGLIAGTGALEQRSGTVPLGVSPLGGHH